MNDKELWASVDAFDKWFKDSQKTLDYSNIRGMLFDAWQAGFLFGMELENSPEFRTYNNLPEHK